jgi:predicted heme/steroid binding protein
MEGDDKSFKQPKEVIKQGGDGKNSKDGGGDNDNGKNYKITLNSGEDIPQGKPMGFLSNNQIYKKKEDIEYGKKSHLEFLTKMANNKDPLGIQGRGGLKGYTMEEIKKHNSKESLWTVLNGNVYDLTTYLDYHPGGEKKLLQGAGRDCTSLFGKKYI